MAIALTKTLDPADYTHPDLQEPLAQVDKFFTPDQNTHRRWEYALALVALHEWVKLQPDQPLGAPYNPHVADVGGSGSTFQRMVSPSVCRIIDPRESGQYGLRVEDLCISATFDAAISISTFEHTKTPLAFLEACHRILKPGGLLFLTFDYIPELVHPENPQPEDTYHFHWMRERIMNGERRRRVQDILETFYGYQLFGGLSYADVGPQVYDYTFASLCLRKALDDAKE